MLEMFIFWVAVIYTWFLFLFFPVVLVIYLKRRYINKDKDGANKMRKYIFWISGGALVIWLLALVLVRF